uniref:Uncharacterized protein n=1 Tax=Arundo donax TaxID=35708 RepID=A0A0A9F1V8_ARUDO
MKSICQLMFRLKCVTRHLILPSSFVQAYSDVFTFVDIALRHTQKCLLFVDIALRHPSYFLLLQSIPGFKMLRKLQTFLLETL